MKWKIGNPWILVTKTFERTRCTTPQAEIRDRQLPLHLRKLRMRADRQHAGMPFTRPSLLAAPPTLSPNVRFVSHLNRMTAL